ncbi:helix-turn-helix transcriptional regulator [Propionimicrobium sp. PCR01-08-3]|uniref:helix-turn-helix domain-containing protein n=1 Tax=Propionimicrobium sp. PCR01-08-3 TaxID=3052086 RepID=UPI00255C3BEB|nr:helix-turn-helix transcriptional regulator [Propionimicrobium sp. PCR01-08-3]WIY83560.1 helix-turn-helix transcriptional regulator [Propionimicrobium sp. PCR01-08-3]
MKVSDLRRHEDVREGRVAKDRAYAVEADRLALAGAVSVAVVRYRSECGLTQTAFAAEMGWKQPQVARLERGDVTPSWETLERLARAGVIEVHLGRQGTIVRELASA